MIALVHGNLHQAAAYNVLLIIAIPYLLSRCAIFLTRLGREKASRDWPIPLWAIYVILAVIVGFWIARNIPYAPFNWLAPHEI